MEKSSKIKRKAKLEVRIMLLLIAGIVLVLLFLIVFLIWFLRIYITIHYSYEGKEQLFHISLSLAKIKLINKDFPLEDLDKLPITKDSMLEDPKIDSILKTIRKGLEVVQSILHNTTLHQLNWTTNIGTGEASTTGVMSGVLWSIKGTIMGYFAEKLILMCNPDIQVLPKFQQEFFETNLNCMVSIRIGKAIQGIIKLTRIYKSKY
ncbi:DUF2953 domain-containing protein [Oceanobacillus caeni]